MKLMKTIKFKNIKEAKKCQKKFQKEYGYYPAIFKIKEGKKKKIIIVKPTGLKKIKRGKK
jgi:hypothetical protein